MYKISQKRNTILFNRYKYDIKRTSSTNNDISHRTSNLIRFPETFKYNYDNNTISGKQNIANQFNVFFTLGKNMQLKLNSSPPKKKLYGLKT